MKFGFTGTQKGMTSEQKKSFTDTINFLCRFYPSDTHEFHHGDCIGADAMAHDSIAEMTHLNFKKIIHPPANDSKRAYRQAEEVLPTKEYLERNHDIVDSSDILIATPKEFKEQLRSGTWATVRYAQKKGKKVITIYPDGSKYGTY